MLFKKIIANIFCSFPKDFKYFRASSQSKFSRNLDISSIICQKRSITWSFSANEHYCVGVNVNTPNYVKTDTHCVVCVKKNNKA